NVRGGLARQPGVHLMYQRSRLQRMARPLLAQMLLRNAPQLGVYQRQQAIQRPFVAVGVFMHEHRNGAIWCHRVYFAILVSGLESGKCLWRSGGTIEMGLCTLQLPSNN